MLFYRVLEGIGMSIVILGITAMENPWYVPLTFMVAGVVFIGIGAWGERDLLRQRNEEKIW